MKYFLAISGLLLFSMGVFAFRRKRNSKPFNRLVSLSSSIRKEELADLSDSKWTEERGILSSLEDRFGRAGLYTRRQRSFCKLTLLLLISSGGLTGILFSGTNSGLKLVFATLIGSYLGILFWSCYLKQLTKNFEREVLFQLPLVLESIILLVESGLGILPALERIVALSKHDGSANPVHRLLHIVYELSAHGMPLQHALATVAELVHIRAVRHVLLHLDISGSEGGELIPSLRSLSSHAHTEWKHSVETRVRRLENFVVFPVFASVLGLMLLTAAVPIVPILEFQERIENRNGVANIIGADRNAR